jgi:hypothetical protein
MSIVLLAIVIRTVTVPLDRNRVHTFQTRAHFIIAQILVGVLKFRLKLKIVTLVFKFPKVDANWWLMEG